MTTLYDRPQDKKYNLSELLNGKKTLSIGRNDGERVQNDICLENHSGKTEFPFCKISRKHASLHYNSDFDSYKIEDHSKNATEVKRDGKTRVLRHESMELRHGDKLFFANYGPFDFHQPSRVRQSTRIKDSKLAAFD
jgi:pSer/pThr/pTyr-binding forkhead associated (FHA) protein